MARIEPKVGTMGPKRGATGGGLSPESVKEAVSVKPKPAAKELPRNMRMEPKSRINAMAKVDKMK